MGKHTGHMVRRGILSLALAGILAGCVAMDRHHGYMPPETEVAQLQIGRDTRDSVVAAIGAPGANGMLDNGNLYYVQSTFRHFGAFAPKVTDRQVLALSFGADGVLSNVARYGLEDGNVVLLSGRVTDAGGNDSTFIRQLMGNIGNFDAATLIGED